MNALTVTILFLLLAPILHAQAPAKPDFASLDDVIALLPREVIKDLKQPSQIEAARRALTRHIKRGGKIWIRVFPDKPISKKPLEVRMGAGKGSVEYWVAQIQPGKVLYEVEGVSEELAREALALAAAKLPIPTVFVKRTVM